MYLPGLWHISASIKFQLTLNVLIHMARFNIDLSCWGRWFLNFSSKSWMVSSIFWLCPLLPKESSKKLEPVLELRLPTHERKKNQKYINGPIFDHGPRSPRIDYFENNRQNFCSHLELIIQKIECAIWKITSKKSTIF